MSSATTTQVLVVDDERQIRRVMRVALEGEGYAVIEARTGEEAIEQLARQHIDLILLDLNMPGMGGMQACREIRAACDSAIVVLSVRSSEEDKIEALDAGADDYVTKPFSGKELLARIRAALRRVPEAPRERPAVRIGDLVIHLDSRTVESPSRPVRLTPKEFDLLEHLVNNPDTTLAHNKLLQAVWGPEYGGEVEYLRVFVNRLRKKIEPDPANPRYIVTIPWLGYRFQPSGEA